MGVKKVTSFSMKSSLYCLLFILFAQNASDSRFPAGRHSEMISSPRAASRFFVCVDNLPGFVFPLLSLQLQNSGKVAICLRLRHLTVCFRLLEFSVNRRYQLVSSKILSSRFQCCCNYHRFHIAEIDYARHSIFYCNLFCSSQKDIKAFSEKAVR